MQASLRATIRTFLKIFLKKSLALKFSWSGLGTKRKKTKIAFKTHRLFEVLRSKLKFWFQYLTGVIV